MEKYFKDVAERRILGGAFTKEFHQVEEDPGGIEGALKKLYAEAAKSELVQGERRVRQRMGMPV